MNIEKLRMIGKNGGIEVNTRLILLNELKNQIKKFTPNIIESLTLDLNKNTFDSVSTEISMVINELNFFLKHTKKLSKPKKVRTNLINFPASSYIYPCPYGVVLIMSPWNYPIQLSLVPLIGAIASGNCVVLKPSNYSPHVSQVLCDLLSPFSDYIQVVKGGREQNQYLLDTQFDYIFFTGGQTVGRLVMQKASNFLTPVTLELGGKSPCIVSEFSNLDLTCKRLVWGKFINGGQTCVAPDYVCVHKSVKQQFINKILYYIHKFYYTNGKINKDFTHIINEKHLTRLLGLIDKDKVIEGGEHDGLLLYPTVINNVQPDDKIMSEEIFGPLMPILEYDDYDKLLDFIKSRPLPLASYLFTDNKIEQQKFTALRFGGGCINDCIMHLTNHHLPFGGVGASGMGAYHGKTSFDTFTHYKSIFVKGKFEINTKYPPCDKKDLDFLNKLIK